MTVDVLCNAKASSLLSFCASSDEINQMLSYLARLPRPREVKRGGACHLSTCMRKSVNGAKLQSELMDLASLESELGDLLAEDELYWIQNDAKFRAAKQTDNYTDFQNFVKV